MESYGWIQWPAMAVTVFASWLVGSNSSGRRHAGFFVFLASNVLWVAWGWIDGAAALIVLQVCLAAMNIRGFFKSDKAETASVDDSASNPAMAPK